MNKHILKLLSVMMILLIPAIASAEPITIYLLKSSAWETTKIYAWEDNGNELANGWSGTAMGTANIDDVDYFVWSAPEDKSSINLIFNDGNNQTEDIKGVTSTTFYKLNSTSGKDITTTVFDPLTLGNPTISATGNTVSITASEDGGNVYYTLDGTDPDKNSEKYTEPFTLEADATIKAIQMKEIAKSEIVSYEFTWQSSEVPVVAADLYCAAEGETVPQLCSTNFQFFPVEGQPKVDGQPDVLYIMGNLLDEDGNTHHWQTDYKVEAKRYGGCFFFENIVLGSLGGDCYFSFVTSIGTTGNSSDWDNIINKTTRYGSNSNDELISVDSPLNYKEYSENIGSATSWKIAEGTYNIIVDFSAKNVTVTKKPAPEFADMAVVTDTNMKATDNKTLYHASATGANNAILEGETLIKASDLNSNVAYIVNNNTFEKIVPVYVSIQNAENGVLGDDSRLVLSDGTTVARYTVGDNTTKLTEKETAIDATDFEANSIVALTWEADNSQNLTFSGSCSLINSVDDVIVRARVPEGWSGLAYSITSAVNDAHQAEGIFTESEGDYLVLTVPAHLIHSTITFSSANTPESAIRRVAADQTFTKTLSGKSMYFDNNGEHWAESEYISTGIEGIEVSAEAEYYNLQGIKIANPTTGVYIRRIGNNVNKVYIK